MSTIDTSTWNPDADLNVEIEGIPLNADASIQQTWRAIQMLMAALKGDTAEIKLTINQPDGTTIVATNQTLTVVDNSHAHTIANVTGLQTALNGKASNASMTGATASADGASGLVPKPEAGEQGKFLRGDGEWGVPADTTYGEATQSASGLMSASDKTKLDGIASGAQTNVIETVKVNGAALTPSSKAVDVTVPQASSTMPSANGTASVGSETAWARGDHVHPLQTDVSGSSGSCTGNAATASAVAWSGVTDKPSAFTPSSHSHGNISNAGAIGSTSGLPIVTGSDGTLQAGAFGTAAGTFCEGNDSRLSDARTPMAHTHGSIANDGKLGTASRAVVTDTDGAIDVSSVTATELGYLSGVTSSIQTQLDAKAADADVVHNSGSESLAGTKTGDMMLVKTSNDIFARLDSSARRLLLAGGTATGAGAGPKFTLFGKDYGGTNAGGYFELHAGSGAGSVNLLGKPDGTLSWDGDPIQTSSDRRLKAQVEAVPDDVLDAWERVRWSRFRWKSSISTKGKAARFHLGMVAQDIQEAFAFSGMDVCAYGILCHVERPADEDSPADERWTVRYAEALAMEAAFQRRRADRLEKRIEALESALRKGVD